MIATIIEAVPWTTARGNEVIKLTVLDDTEWKYFMYFAPIALHALDVLTVQARVPFIRKGAWSQINLQRMVGKFISVNREKIRMKDKVWDTLMLDMRYPHRMQYLNSGLGWLDLQELS